MVIEGETQRERDGHRGRQWKIERAADFHVYELRKRYKSGKDRKLEGM